MRSGRIGSRLTPWAVVLLLLGGAARAAEPYRVRSFIQPDQGIVESQSLRLVLEVQGEGNPTVSPPTLGQMKNLRVLGGPERVFKSSWINGQFSTTSQFVYTLTPVKVGPAEIPILSIVADGKRYQTQAIRFDVAAAPAGQPPRRSSGQTPRGESAAEADVFLRAEIGSQDVWVGESVPLSVSLYNAERISSPSLTAEPALSSFWVEQVDVDPESEAYRTTIEGRRYTVYPMVRRVIVPQTSGEIEIEPFVMTIPIRARRAGDPFDVFSFGRTQNVMRKTRPLKLNVRPLPTKGRPADFSGAVGRYTMKVALDRTDTEVNDAVALTATVEGEGFLRAVTPPVLQAPTHLKLFDPEVRSSSRTVQGKMISRKTWEWILVPLAPGEIKLPELSFHYFDSGTGAYAVARDQPPPLIVEQAGEIGDSSLARGDVRLQRRDLAFIKPLIGDLAQKSPRVHERGLYVTLLLLPLVWVPLVVLLGRHRSRLQQNFGLARSRRARSRARGRLRAAAKHVADAEGPAFHEELARALIGYVADRFNRSAAGLTYELADELLASKGLDEELRREFRTCLETCDFARYVSAAGNPDRRSEILSEAQALLDRMDRAW